VTVKGEFMNITDAIDLNLLIPENTEFYITSGGFAGMKIGSTDYQRISLRRALPIKNPDEYISVADKSNKEIGLIRRISDFSEAQQLIILSELNKRYYSPNILEIKSVKDKLGYVYFELLIDNGNAGITKSCAVKDVSKNIRMLDEERLAIFDTEGNRYIINSLSGLDRKSVKKLEPYLF